MHVISHPVYPGDHLDVSLQLSGTRTWTITFSDPTQGWSITTTVAYEATTATAEWITEAPGTWSTALRFQTLGDYTHVTFGTMKANESVPKGNLVGLTMTQDGAILSYPSTYNVASGTFDVNYGTPRPVITSISPPSGPAGTSVRIDGENLGYPARVSFGTAPPKTVWSDTTTHLTVTVPAHTPGKVDVTVSLVGQSPVATTSLSSAAGVFTYTTTTVVRLFGQTADATAVTELTRAFPYASGSCPASRAVVVATTKTYQDALSSQYLAQSLTTGTLLTPTESLSSVTASTLENEGITTVYVVGGPLAVSTTVVKAISNLTAYGCGGTSPSGKITVHRLYGQTAYGTAGAVAEHVGSAPTKSFPGAYGTTNAAGGTGRYNDTDGSGSSAPTGPVPTAILANGTEFQDAQAASVVCYHTKLPLLLTSATALSPTALGAIQELGIKQVILMGGPLAVTNTVVAALVKAGVSVLRIAGKDYTDTTIQLARFEAAGPTTGLGWTPGYRVMVARGNGFTDGIAGALLDGPHNTATGAAGTARPLLLIGSPTTVGTYLTAFLQLAGHTGIGETGAKTIIGLTILGGPLAVSTATVTQMQTALEQ